MSILKGGLGYFFVADKALFLFAKSMLPSTSMAFFLLLDVVSFLAFSLVKKFLEDFLELLLLPMLLVLPSLLLVPIAKMAKFLILFLTMLMLQSSLALSLRM